MNEETKQNKADEPKKPAIAKEWFYASAFAFLGVAVMPPMVPGQAGLSAGLSGLFFGIAAMIAFYKLSGRGGRGGDE